MATGEQIETLTGELARETPKRDREKVKTGLSTAGDGLSKLVANKTLLDTVVADASAAGQDTYTLAQIQSDWGSNLAAVVGSGFMYSGKTGIPAIAQLIADMSEQAGLDGGESEIRIYRDGVQEPVDQDT